VKFEKFPTNRESEEFAAGKRGFLAKRASFLTWITSRG